MLRNQPEPRPLNDTAYRIATTVTISGVTFIVLFALLHVIQADLDPTWRFASEYALGTAGFLMPLAFLALAVSSVCLVVLLWHRARGIIGRIGTVLIGVSGAGMALAAIFPTDPITTPDSEATLSGTMHQVGGLLNLTPYAVLLLTISLSRTAPWKPIRRHLWIVTALALVATIGFMATAAAATDGFGPGVYTGLFGRIILIAYAVWVAVIGLHGRRLALRTRSNQDTIAA